MYVTLAGQYEYPLTLANTRSFGFGVHTVDVSVDCCVASDGSFTLVATSILQENRE